MAADARGTLSTWPLAVVRHARAHPRSSWTDDDWLRPSTTGAVSRRPTWRPCSPATASSAS